MGPYKPAFGYNNNIITSQVRAVGGCRMIVQSVCAFSQNSTMGLEK